MVENDFKVLSLEAIGTIEQDRDVGAIRVSGVILRKLGGRNSLVRVSLIDHGRTRKSLIRIVRAATGERKLLKDEIALQYDDRRELGIKKAGASHTLRIEPVNQWLRLPEFLLRHSSPLVRREAAFSISLMVVGAVIGFLLGIFVSWIFQSSS